MSGLNKYTVPPLPPCGATLEEPGPYECTLTLIRLPRCTCYHCRKSIINGGKCAVVTLDGEEAES